MFASHTPKMQPTAIGVVKLRVGCIHTCGARMARVIKRRSRESISAIWNVTTIITTVKYHRLLKLRQRPLT
jgi:hypothetical protein